MDFKTLTKNGLALAIVLAVVFLSQKSPDNLPSDKVKKFGEELYFRGITIAKEYWAKSADWFMSNIYSRASKEAAERGGAVKEAVEKQKDNLARMSWKKIKNYFAEKFSKLFGTKVE